MYEFTTRLFFQLANAFFWPVAIALLVLLAVSILDLGALIVQARRRARQPRTDLEAVARALLSGFRKASSADALAGLPISPTLERFWRRVHRHLDTSSEHLDLWLEEALQQEEITTTSRLDTSRALIRIGPMLGLAGTIIPLGPALQSLLGGNMAEMVNHLVIGFGAVVVGLMMSGLAYVSTLVRERWTRADLKEMENLCEFVMRGLKSASPREAVRASV
jgi:biopolymer transport protein ExbB/TolQ